MKFNTTLGEPRSFARCNSPDAFVDHCERRLRRMHIKPDPTDSVRHRQHLPAMCRPTPPSLGLREAFGPDAGFQPPLGSTQVREVLTVARPADRTTSTAGLTRHTV
jgi:hypothetical protein